MALTKVSLTGLAVRSLVALASGVRARVLSNLELGVKWQICIDEPIKHDTVDDFIPKEAAVFDIDLSHAQDYPEMIPKLKVWFSMIILDFRIPLMLMSYSIGG